MSQLSGDPPDDAGAALDLVMAQFATPAHDSLRTAFARQVAEGAAAGAVTALVRKRGRDIRERSIGLADSVEQLSDVDLPIGLAWSPVFGAVHAAAADNGDPIAVATRLVLESHARGGPVPAPLCVTFEEPVAMTWGTRTAPSVRTVEIAADSGPRVVPASGDPAPGAVDEVPYLPAAADRGTPVLFRGRRDALDIPDGVNPEDLTTDVPGATVAAWAEAMAVLAESSPRFTSWVGTVIDSLLVLADDGRPGRFRSGSSSQTPGAVVTSGLTEPMLLAEIAVHEASHQYYHLARRASALTRDDDEPRYYSPIVGEYRTLDRMIAAYHAFVNVARFYADIMATGPGPDAERCRVRLARTLPILLDYRGVVDDNPSLTRAGAAFTRPLSLKTSTLVDAGDL